ncbi:MAG TPA: SMP-30/gluconolactonase/LRE family protein [Chthoniobacteraceae bacterium]|nr:SMP-30/gluconolactonase/LRE family protein [Chthoniobacteraceae bacterium]
MKITSFLSLPLLLAGLLTLAPPVRAATLAEHLAAAKFTQYAKVPGYSEGPTWVNGDLFFCGDGLRRVDKSGNVILWLDINPAGTALRGDGHLLICDNKHKALLSLAPDGTLSVLADSFEGKPLNSLNDLTVDARGNIYWTDPSGSSLDHPTGVVFRLRPDGTVSRIGNTFAFPNGLDVDPAGRFLYLVESQSKKILRFPVPADDQPLGPAETFYELGGSGGDGCAFDAAGNFWVADYQRPETKQGRITVLSREGKLLGGIDVPAQVVSNLTFGGPENDKIFCTTGNPAGVFHAKVGVKGFPGHPGVALKPIRTLALQPFEGAHPLHPRRFGVPGNVGASRGWYIWRKFDPATWTAELQHEANGEIFTAKVIPWVTGYRHLVYDAHVDELLPGERINPSFNADGDQKHGWLVHYQDEMCQMKGHGHAWIIQSVQPGGQKFSAQVYAGDKVFEEKPRDFELAPEARIVRDAEHAADNSLQKGERLYFTWTLTGDRRVVHTVADDAGLELLKKEEAERVDARLAREGLGSFIESVDAETVHLLIFSSFWSHANRLKPAQTLDLRATTATFVPTGDPIAAEILTRKNLGTYGSGASELTLRLKNPADAKKLGAWSRGQVISTAGR